MKKIIALLACLAMGALTFGEVVAWKGMEFGIEQNPKWLRSLVEKHDENSLTSRRTHGFSTAREMRPTWKARGTTPPPTACKKPSVRKAAHGR